MLPEEPFSNASRYLPVNWLIDWLISAGRRMCPCWLSLHLQWSASWRFVTPYTCTQWAASSEPCELLPPCGASASSAPSRSPSTRKSIFSLTQRVSGLVSFSRYCLTNIYHSWTLFSILLHRWLGDSRFSILRDVDRQPWRLSTLGGVNVRVFCHSNDRNNGPLCENRASDPVSHEAHAGPR